MNEEEKESIHGFREHMRFHRHNWLRHNAMVPKGFLRCQVLQALNEKPMSGSELMDQIQKHTGGIWKPSPGSIYPMLSWLQDNQYVKELPTENGLKRYELTKSGKDLLEEQAKMHEKLRGGAGFMAFPFFDRTYSNIPPEKSVEIGATMKRLVVASVSIGRSLEENYSEKDLNEVLQLLNQTAEKLEQISTKLKGDNV